jgi:hypothetical protein
MKTVTSIAATEIETAMIFVSSPKLRCLTCIKPENADIILTGFESSERQPAFVEALVLASGYYDAAVFGLCNSFKSLEGPRLGPKMEPGKPPAT